MENLKTKFHEDMNADNELPAKKLKIVIDNETKDEISDSRVNKSNIENSSSYVKNEFKQRIGPFQTENDVGITEYLSKHEGFHGILKHRYSDFLVNEIQEDSIQLHLTDFSPPVEDANSFSLVEQLGSELAGKIQDLCSEECDESEPVLIDVTDMDKEKRRIIHVAIRQNCVGLDSSTENREDKKFIVVTKTKKQKGNKRRQVWPHSRGNYTHFLLYKENTDTLEAISTIANLLRMPSSAFSYAGNKDKRAKTTQNLSVYRVAAGKLLALNEKLKLIKIGNIQYKNQSVKLGDLSGNHFKILLRNITGSTEQVKDAMTSFINIGFINYYGMQRFGTTSVPTYKIGKAFLEGKWQDAIDLILNPNVEEDSNVDEYRLIWSQTKDAKAAFDQLRRKGGVEGHLLRGLITRGSSDLINALNAIPRNSRLMYLHSFQSYIWNHIASFRIKQFGLKPIIGDLIMPQNVKVPLEEENENVSFHEKLQTVSVDNINSVSIYDLVLPLPGNAIIYPENEVGKRYKELLEKEGISLSNFTSKVKIYSLGGAYRHLVVRPKDVEWSLVNYDDDSQSLLRSDLDKLLGTPLVESQEGGHKGLKIEFSLPLSSYATMAVREILQTETTVWVNKEAS